MNRIIVKLPPSNQLAPGPRLARYKAYLEDWYGFLVAVKTADFAVLQDSARSWPHWPIRRLEDTPMVVWVRKDPKFVKQQR